MVSLEDVIYTGVAKRVGTLDSLDNFLKMCTCSSRFHAFRSIAAVRVTFLLIRLKFSTRPLAGSLRIQPVFIALIGRWMPRCYEVVCDTQIRSSLLTPLPFSTGESKLVLLSSIIIMLIVMP